MSSSGIAYPPPTYIPPLPIFNPTNFPPIPPSGSTSGGGGQSNIFPDGLSSGNTIQLDGGTGGAGGDGTERSINGISYLNFIDTANTSPVGATPLTTLSQTATNFTIGGTNTIEIDITGSALKFNGVAVGTGSGNVNTADSNTYATGTTQTFDNAVVGNTLDFNNTGSILMSSYNAINSANLSFPQTFPTSTTGQNAGLGVFWNNSNGGGETDLICYGQGGQGGLSIYACNVGLSPTLLASFYSTSNISLNKPVNITGNLQTTSYISSPTLTAPTTSNLPSTYGSFYNTNGTPYFTYNNSGTITTSPLVISSTLSNYATLTTGTNSFTNVNTFSQFPTISATQLLSTDSSTKLATTAWVQSAIPSLSNYPTLNGSQYWTGYNTFNNGISLPNVSNPPPATYLFATLYSYNNTLNYSTAGSVIVNPVALTRTANTFSGTNNFTGTTTAITQATTDNSTNVATTAFVKSAIPQTYNITSSVGIYTGVGTPAQTYWTFTFGSPTYGNTFSFIITSNTTPTPLALSAGTLPLTSNGTYGCMTGNGILQTYTSSPSSTIFNAYNLSNINTLSIPFIITSSNVNTGNWFLTIAVYNQNIAGYTLNMKIITTS
jgi:hypothetical protein